MRLALGTVQFGLAYGVANQRGQVGFLEAQRIIELARSNGVDTLDTAIAYGESESTLGKLDLRGFNLITKLPALPHECKDTAGWVESQLAGALERLNVPRVHGLMLHRPGQLLEKEGQTLYRALEAMKNQGLVECIGLSIYDPLELNQLLFEMSFDLVQAPFNLLDRRLIDTGWLERLQASGTRLHVRSVFMQGLLLMAASERPPKFSRWNSLWISFDRWLEDENLTPLQACLRYAQSFDEIDRLVVGVESAEQLREIIEESFGGALVLPENIHTSDVDLLDPSRWASL